MVGDVTGLRGQRRGWGRDRSGDITLLALKVEEGVRTRNAAASRSWQRHGKDASPKPPEETQSC